MDLHLSGKVAVVTGGSHGIGRSIALGLAAEGCDLAICGRTEAALRRTANDVAVLGQQVVSSLADVTKPADVERFVSETISEFGGVDLLVANAGGSSGAGLLDASREDWGTTFELNSFHAACATRAVVRCSQMSAKKRFLLITFGIVAVLVALVIYSAMQVHATPAERAKTLAGDELISQPIGAVDHAITIHRPPHEVWPWLVQMGSGRAGWYAYDIIDNGGQHSAERITLG